MVENPSSHCLFGKFFTSSTPPSFEETEQSLLKQWNLSGDLTIRKLVDDSETLSLEFRRDKDKAKVLKDRPYNVNGVIFVIKDPNSPDMIDFTVASFVVAVVGLPSYLHTKEVVPQLKSLVGENNPELLRMPENIDRCFYFRVDVDLKKPLRPRFYELGEKRFVGFKYKNLGDFCYKCGMVGHVDKSCDQVRLERDLNDTSTTYLYGPWLRFCPFIPFYEIVVDKPEDMHIGVNECEKTLSYAQFFIEIEFNKVAYCSLYSMTKTVSTHRFRFPCSYLDTEPMSTDFNTSTTSKAYEVIRREICDNAPSSFPDIEQNLLKKPDVIGVLVEQFKLIKKDEFSCDDKWLTLKLQINKKYEVTPVDFETILAISRDNDCEQRILSRISDLIKNRVEKKENLLSLSSWESQIRQVVSEIGLTRYMPPIEVSRSANRAMRNAVEMEFSSTSCTIPADRSTVSGLERFKVLGPDMDRLDPCMICVEEMFLGEEATNLPCSHVFHSSCIEKWLQAGHKCPLCGFKLLTQK